MLFQDQPEAWIVANQTTAHIAKCFDCDESARDLVAMALINFTRIVEQMHCAEDRLPPKYTEEAHHKHFSILYECLLQLALNEKTKNSAQQAAEGVVQVLARGYVMATMPKQQ